MFWKKKIRNLTKEVHIIKIETVLDHEVHFLSLFKADDKNDDQHYYYHHHDMTEVKKKFAKIYFFVFASSVSFLLWWYKDHDDMMLMMMMFHFVVVIILYRIESLKSEYHKIKHNRKVRWTVCTSILFFSYQIIYILCICMSVNCICLRTWIHIFAKNMSYIILGLGHFKRLPWYLSFIWRPLRERERFCITSSFYLELFIIEIFGGLHTFNTLLVGTHPYVNIFGKNKISCIYFIWTLVLICYGW